MIQVRCHECGYLQTLSEERFLSIPESFLSCPHCNARVPKEWAPSDADSVPEEERHKVLAFSRRILNGGDVGKEVIYALEALVRRYGAIDCSNKALGLGYAALGERSKAEEFLLQARDDDPKDKEVLSCLLEVLLGQNKFADAVRTGKALVEVTGPQLDDEDVARVALALLGMGHSREAQALMAAHPYLDGQNPVVRQARKQINRSTGSRLGGLYAEKGPLNRLFSGVGKNRLRNLTLRARSFIGWPPRAESATVRPAAPAVPQEAKPSGSLAKISPQVPTVVEYWIYAPVSNIPEWEAVRERLGESYARNSERERAFRLLASLLEKNSLKIEYIIRSDAPELFQYPEELIVGNAPEFSSQNKKTLLEAQMIVRVKLMLDNFSGREYVSFMVRFVDAVRLLTGGIVQDATSHKLWGVHEWQKCAENLPEDSVGIHVKIEALDEDGTIWIHSHGMQKFGLADIEMDGIPVELATTARGLILMVVHLLISTRNSQREINRSLKIPGLPVRLVMEMRPPDEEDHFPAGSLRILPFVDGYDASSPDAAKHALRLLQSAWRSRSDTGATGEETSKAVACLSSSDHDATHLREKILAAHVKAKNELPNFKKSFQTAGGAEDRIHAVKIGFPAEGGQYEWMWVSLEHWRGHSLIGHLENDPVLRKDLEKGSTVHISEEDIFDWVITHGGDVLKGAFTEDAAVAS